MPFTLETLPSEDVLADMVYFDLLIDGRTIFFSHVYNGQCRSWGKAYVDARRASGDELSWIWCDPARPWCVNDVTAVREYARTHKGMPVRVVNALNKHIGPGFPTVASALEAL
jgi:hypothetical protein